MFVVKVGGGSEIKQAAFVRDLAKHDDWVLVHGGAHELNALSEKLGHPPTFVTSVSGHESRYTDRETLEMFNMVYAGKVNKNYVEMLQQAGVDAVGLTGLDGRLVAGRRKSSLKVMENGRKRVLRGDHSGTIETVNVDLLQLLIEAGYAPVLTPPAISHEGEAINVDGDRFAAKVAEALGADALLLLSDVPGLMGDLEDPTSLIDEIPYEAIDAHIEMVAKGRMKKKLLGAKEALDGGVGHVVIGDARGERPVTDAVNGAGTRGGLMSADAVLNGQSPIDIEDRHGGGAYRPAPVTMVRGEGVHLYDADGNAYLDFNTGIGVAALGHAHPAIVQAVSDQVETLVTCSAGYFHNDVRAQFTKRLTEIAPEGLDRVFLVNSGSEAVETAIKLARAHTGRPKIIATERGFHGRTLGALSATHKRPYRQPFQPLVPDFEHVPFGDVEALQDAVDEQTAAVLMEPIQGEGGIYPAPDGYLQIAREVCDAHGALLVFDEIQSGMGRTGRWFACEHDEVTPDALCLAKPLGGGVPLGATVFRDELAFGKGQHGSTFGGNPLACRAGLAFLETIETEGLLDHVAEMGAYLRDGLEKIAADRPERCREVRGRGLMLALQLRGKAGPLLKTLLTDHRLLALSAGPTTIRLLPPYTITRDHADQALNAIAEALG